MTQHSSYWLDDTIFDDQHAVLDTTPDITRITKLAAVRRAIANFVTILTNRNDLTVEYSSGTQSYATKQAIVLSATDDPDKFDFQVGLALHEASHILLTDFTYLEHWADKLRHGYRYNARWVEASTSQEPATDCAREVFHPSLVKLLPPVNPSVTYATDREYFTAIDLYGQTVTTLFGYIKTLMNVLEDRRIDAYVFQRAGGYRPYYTALYNEDTLTAEIGKNLKYNPEWREPTVANYINRILLSIHPDADARALPGLDVLHNMLDLATIDRVAPEANSTWKLPQYESQPRLYREASELLVVILRFAALHLQQQPQTQSNQASIPNGMPNVQQESVLPNLDIGRVLQSIPQLDGENEIDFSAQAPDAPPTTKTGKPKKVSFNAKKANRDVEKFKNQTAGTVTKKKIKKTEKDAIDSLDAAKAEIVPFQGKLKGGVAMVTRKVTKEMLSQDWFVFGTTWATTHNNALINGRRMGQILQSRLEVRNDPVLTKTTRLTNGNIERRLLAQLGMDITSVFSKTRIDTYKPALLHLSLDASGSMSGTKWHQVMTVATALAYVGSKSRTIDVVISLRGGNSLPIVSIVYDSRVDKFTHWMQFAPNFQPGGATPEGLCYEATMNLILDASQTHEVYFINFSDGQPSFYLSTDGIKNSRGRKTDYPYYADFAVKHTNEQIRIMQAAGVHVLAYFIGHGSYDSSSMSTFRKMYGADAVFVDVTNATMVLKTLSKVLLQRGG
jgi:hypothetical protein